MKQITESKKKQKVPKFLGEETVLEYLGSKADAD
jgi:hypothetical protein